MPQIDSKMSNELVQVLRTHVEFGCHKPLQLVLLEYSWILIEENNE